MAHPPPDDLKVGTDTGAIDSDNKNVPIEVQLDGAGHTMVLRKLDWHLLPLVSLLYLLSFL